MTYARQLDTSAWGMDNNYRPSMCCVHCRLLPGGTHHTHAVVAVAEEAVDRVWFSLQSICAVQKFADELAPNDGALGDWEHRFCDNGTELMVLKIDGTQHIW
jgi:hypothetical protein